MNEGTMNRQLVGYEPMNDYFFYTCFYDSLKPILANFEIPIEGFFSNIQYVYCIDNGELSVKFMLKDDLKSLLNSYGIEMQARQGGIDVLSYIRESIDKGCPVIAFVDLFYLSHRKNEYLKMHSDHSLLIYGYDNTQYGLYAIENTEKNTLDFHKMKIDMKEVERGYYSYIERFNDFGFTICRFTRKRNLLFTKESQYVRYWKFRNEFLEERQNSINVLSNYISHFEKIIMDPYEFDCKIEQLCIHAEFILKAYKGEGIILNYYFVNDEINEFYSQLNHLWSKINTILQYAYCSKRYNLSKLKHIVNNLEQICEIEKKVAILFR